MSENSLCAQRRLRKSVVVTFFLVAALGIFFSVRFLVAFSVSVMISYVPDTYHFSIDDDGRVVYGVFLAPTSVGDAMRLYNITINRDDNVIPSLETIIMTGTCIRIDRYKTVSLDIAGKKKTIQTYGRTVRDILQEQKISHDDNDDISPSLNSHVFNGSHAAVVFLEKKQVVVKQDIPYETIETNDDKLGWQTRKITQEGKKGVKEIVYDVFLRNGKEVQREIVSEKVVEEHLDKKIVQGTLVKLGKKHNGAASWYRFTGTLAAANPWLPKGSYVKVTNKANGKSVIVVINDRGPFVPGRIIDLDYVAFQKIASVGAGVIDVIVEEIIN